MTNTIVLLYDESYHLEDADQNDLLSIDADPFGVLDLAAVLVLARVVATLNAVAD